MQSFMTYTFPSKATISARYQRRPTSQCRASSLVSKTAASGVVHVGGAPAASSTRVWMVLSWIFSEQLSGNARGKVETRAAAYFQKTEYVTEYKTEARAGRGSSFRGLNSTGTSPRSRGWRGPPGLSSSRAPQKASWKARFEARIRGLSS